MSVVNLDKVSNSSPKPKRYFVRAAAAMDLSQLVEILILSFYPMNRFNRLFYPLMRLGLTEDLKARLKTPASRYVCLAAVQQSTDIVGVQSNVLVGTVEISLRSQLWPPLQPRRPYIANLAVNVQDRRQGVAQKLLEACESIALQWGGATLFLHVKPQNTQALKLYQKLGYQPYLHQPRWLSTKRLLLSKRLSEKM